MKGSDDEKEMAAPWSKKIRTEPTRCVRPLLPRLGQSIKKRRFLLDHRKINIRTYCGIHHVMHCRPELVCSFAFFRANTSSPSSPFPSITSHYIRHGPQNPPGNTNAQGWLQGTARHRMCPCIHMSIPHGQQPHGTTEASLIFFRHPDQLDEFRRKCNKFQRLLC